MNPLKHQVTIFMPVSRNDFLPKIFAGLEMLQCDKKNTNLIVVVDGDANLYVEVRNFVEFSKFNEKLCVQFQTKHKLKHYDVYARRRRIADVNNFVKDKLNKCDFIFGIEDDTLFGPGTLKRLLYDYSQYPYAGFIEGVELGRWGIPYVGAWKIDDVYEPTHIQSVLPEKGITEIDAGGLYCYLTRFESFMKHNHEPFSDGFFGPDVNFGLNLRREGMTNYIDWGISTIHRTKDKDISLFNTQPKIVEFRKNGNRWNQNSHM